MVSSVERRKEYYRQNREKIINDNRWYYGRTKKELENEVAELSKRVHNLKIIVEWKDRYIEELKQYIIDLKLNNDIE